MGQQTPLLATSANEVEEDGVDDLMHRPLARTTTWLGGRNERGEYLPFVDREIAGIRIEKYGHKRTPETGCVADRAPLSTFSHSFY
jgi:hypothetical protein